MEYTRLGKTGLKVSRLALGCMSYGDPTTPDAHPWALTEDKAQSFFRISTTCCAVTTNRS